MSGLKAYRLPAVCTAQGCDDEKVVSVITDDGELIQAFCESHFQAVINPTIAFDDSGEMSLVVK